jgi:predicted transcriptional regulator
MPRTSKLTAADVMQQQFHALDADTPVSEAIDRPDQDFPIKSGGALIGILSRAQLLRIAADEGDNAPVGGALEGALTAVEKTTTLADAYKLMHAQQAHAAGVFERGELVGLLTRERVAQQLGLAAPLVLA